MATQWSTFPVEFKGGLISNLSPLQHGINAIGSATVLQNLEPDRRGGYTKIKGYDKFSNTEVYGSGNILGIKVISSGRIVVARVIDSTAVTALQTVTADVNGAVSASANVALDGNVGTIAVGQYVTSSSISGTVKVQTITDQNNIVLDTAVTLADDEVLTFGPLGTADIGKTAYYVGTGTDWTHMLTTSLTLGGKVRHSSYNFDGDEKTVFVDGTNYPVIYNPSGNVMTALSASSTNINTDLEGAENVIIFKNTGFYSKGNTLYFSAPYSVDNFSVADGAGTISVGNNVTGFAVFRDQLIIFTTDSIKRLTGNTSNDFQLTSITDRIGCISSDSIQEFGGDIIYLAPDGIRLLSATDRIGDFALDVASDTAYKEAEEIIGSTSMFSSCIIREKSQYRIFGYQASQNKTLAKGLIATKFTSQGASGIQWATTKGIKPYVIDSNYKGNNEAIMFGNEDGFVYRLESGTSFANIDGIDEIEAVYESPYMPITDPQIRKTAYKLTLYTEPRGNMELNFKLLFDFDSGKDTRVVQPDPIIIGSTVAGGGGSGVAIFGAATSLYGSSTFGGKLQKVYNENLIGSFHTVAMRIEDHSTNPSFTLDTAVLEYRQNDRQ